MRRFNIGMKNESALGLNHLYDFCGIREGYPEEYLESELEDVNM